MSQKEKARPAGGAAEQAKQGNHKLSGNPYKQFNTGGSGSQFNVEAEV